MKCNKTHSVTGARHHPRLTRVLLRGDPPMKRQRYDERMEAGELVDVVRKQLTMLSNGVKKVARMFRGDVLQIDGAEVFNVSEYELADDTKVVLFEDSS